LLLTKAAAMVVVVRLGLWLLPYRFIRRVLRSVSVLPNPQDLKRSDRVAWAVQTAARYVPKASCLVQALAGHILLGAEGYPTDLRIGVRKNDAGRFEAHAWLESCGRTVLGNVELTTFAPLLVWTGQRQ